MEKEFSRRSFIKSSLIGAAGLASLSVLSGCSNQSSGATATNDDETTEVDYASKVTETKECDIVVVGAGMSGLAAAVEALDEGAKVIVLESQKNPGGNGNVTSCVMGVGTDMQKALGIEITPAQIISTEMKTFNYSVDGRRWSTLINNSKENIEWLMEQGAIFSTVDNYHSGAYATAHEWAADDGRAGATNYVAPMVTRLESLGGELLTESAGKELILGSDGSIVGIYAETSDGVLQVNCKAVIIATGGYANNDDLIKEKGYDIDLIEPSGTAGHNGDGIDMALKAGAKSWLEKSSLMEYPMNPKIGMAESGSISRMAEGIWVNGEGYRFVDENCGSFVPAYPACAVRTQDISYVLFDQEALDGIQAGSLSSTTPAESVAKNVDAGNIFKADTIAELAKAADIDADTLVMTVETYNAYCAAASDDEFGKDASKLHALTAAPYYLSQNNGIAFLTTIGGIDTTKDAEVRAEAGGVIKGLYAVGVDGVENYRGLYTIDIPGSCNANNINSGRTAARNAIISCL